MHFCTNCRAAHHGVVLKVTVPIKHLSFPLLPPQGETDEGGMHSEKISLILQVPLVDNQSAEKWIDSRTGMGWGGHEPPSVLWFYTGLYLPAEKVEPITIRRGGGAIHTGAHQCVPGPLPLRHSCTSIAAPSPLHRGSPRGGNATT